MKDKKEKESKDQERKILDQAYLVGILAIIGFMCYFPGWFMDAWYMHVYVWFSCFHWHGLFQV